MSLASIALWGEAWRWLATGLGPQPIATLFIAFCVTAATAALLALLRVLFAAPLMGSIFIALICPLVEELTCHIFLVGAVMTMFWPCAAPQTTVVCGLLFGLMHIPTAVQEGDPLRVADGLILGFFNTIACMVYLRLFLKDAPIERWLVAYGALVLAHAVYNLLALFFKAFPMLSLALRVGGFIFTVAAWFAWMPKLIR